MRRKLNGRNKPHSQLGMKKRNGIRREYQRRPQQRRSIPLEKHLRPVPCRLPENNSVNRAFRGERGAEEKRTG